MRRKDREITDRARINEILDTAKVVHLGLVDEGRPYVVPLHYGYEWVDDKLVVWCHGAREGRKINVISANAVAFVEMECDVQDISGGDVPCDYGSSYASVMGEGEAHLVTDPDKKAHGLQVLMRKQTGRDFQIPERMLPAVAVIKIDITELSAKARPYPTMG